MLTRMHDCSGIASQVCYISLDVSRSSSSKEMPAVSSVSNALSTQHLHRRVIGPQNTKVLAEDVCDGRCQEWWRRMGWRSRG